MRGSSRCEGGSRRVRAPFHRDHRSMSMRILKSRLIYSNNELAINSGARGRARLTQGRHCGCCLVTCAKNRLSKRQKKHAKRCYHQRILRLRISRIDAREYLRKVDPSMIGFSSSDYLTSSKILIFPSDAAVPR